MLRVTLHEREPATTVRSVVELEEVLSKASKEARTRELLAGIMLDAENGTRLTIVVGGDDTVLTFDSAGSNPPYYVSKGPVDVDQPAFTCYLNFEHHTEFSEKSVIPIASGLNAAREFFFSGEVPRCVTWEEV